MKWVYSLFNPGFFMKSFEHLCKTSKTFCSSSLRDLMGSLIMSSQKSGACLEIVLLDSLFYKICITIICTRFFKLLALMIIFFIVLLLSKWVGVCFELWMKPFRYIFNNSFICFNLEMILISQFYYIWLS